MHSFRECYYPLIRRLAANQSRTIRRNTDSVVREAAPARDARKCFRDRYRGDARILQRSGDPT